MKNNKIKITDKLTNELTLLITKVAVNGIASREDMVEYMPDIMTKIGSKTEFPSYYMDTHLRVMRKDGLVEILNSVGLRGCYKLKK
jgi:hypothetical protein